MSYVFPRRRFLSTLGWIASSYPVAPKLLEAWAKGAGAGQGAGDKPYGSGYLGEWVEDESGLPAFHYTCDQMKDPRAIAPVDEAFRSPTDQTHQVGNDRLVAAVSNYGYVQVRQDEGSPKFLNDYCPERGQYGGGVGFLTDGQTVLSTYYPGNAEAFDRIFGVGYLRKKVTGKGYAIDQVIFAPFGDDPVLVSQVTIRNHGNTEALLRWIEYWGCQPYQFSYRSFMQATVEGRPSKSVELRRNFGNRFAHDVQLLEGNTGLLERKRFLGRSAEDEQAWKDVQAYLATNPSGFFGGPVRGQEGGAGLEDLDPPATFLASLDGPADGFSAAGKAFFGSGGAINPTGVTHDLDQDLSVRGPEAALLLERKIKLEPGESRTLYFLYGYLTKEMKAAPLIEKYRRNVSSLWGDSSRKWIEDGMRFSTKEEPWVERELTWDHYYLRSNLTFDSFFQEHILSQGHVYQYIMGFQGAARDPLQHVLPFLFSNPGLVKEVLRYTLKEVRPDGSIPYGIVGYGMPMPTTLDNASDFPMWVLWVTSEYVLATRDTAFLSEEVPTYPLYGSTAGKESVRNLLARCYRHLAKDVGTGEHGIMRMLMDDWTDALVLEHVPAKLRTEYLRTGESTLNSAMATYVFDFYANMLTYAGIDTELAADARRQAEEYRKAVRAQWIGRWFRRAWLGPTLGWVGEDSLWIEPQPWAIIGGVTSPEQARELVGAMDELIRRPSPIGAMQISKGSHTAEEMGEKIGTGEDGGVWPSLNGTLVWSLAMVDGAMAWDEWKKNSFARHAEVYPEIWYSTWSGPDTLNSVLNKYAGQTMLSDALLKQRDVKAPLEFTADFGWTDFPVMNMHPHAWQLYMVAKLLGLEFNGRGLVLAPKIPLKSYRFDSPLLGMIKSEHGYEGWYAPSGGSGTWTVALRLPDEEQRPVKSAEVNGRKQSIKRGPNREIELEGEGGPGKPLRWSVRT
ncbi:MAG: hypothetical protein WB763_26270 [Terriglobia bacterium]|jgi:hypothetical protein